LRVTGEDILGRLGINSDRINKAEKNCKKYVTITFNAFERRFKGLLQS